MKMPGTHILRERGKDPSRIWHLVALQEKGGGGKSFDGRTTAPQESNIRALYPAKKSE